MKNIFLTPYENALFRSGVDAIAKNCARLVMRVDPKRERLEYLLQIRPNIYMSSFDFLYKVVTTLYTENNSFIFVDRKNGSVLGLYPLTPSSFTVKTDKRNKIFIQFYFNNGKTEIFDYRDLIHLRRFFKSDFLGSDNTAVDDLIALSEAETQGAARVMSSTAKIQGILKFNSLINERDKKRQKDSFISDYLSLENNPSGVIPLDESATYTPLTSSQTVLDAEQSKLIRDKIFSYLGISENVVNGNFDENGFSAFYESVIEPQAAQMQAEFTSKIFTEKEIKAGARIVFDATDLQLMNNSSKISMIGTLLPMGLLSINEARSILNLPKVDGGDKYLQSLNYVDAKEANTYQLNK